MSFLKDKELELVDSNKNEEISLKIQNKNEEFNKNVFINYEWKKNSILLLLLLYFYLTKI